jgi:lytic murein transglycosylase
MMGARRVVLRWTFGWTVASAITLALGPAEAEQRAGILQRSAPAVEPKPVQVADAQTYIPETIQGSMPANSAFERYKSYLIEKARSAGVRQSTIDANVRDLELNSRVIQLDQAQPIVSNPGAISPFAPYRAAHVTPQLIARGQARYSEYWPRLQQIELRYGVDPAVAMAIYGQETNYGSITGGFDLLSALASLAYEGRRRTFFEDEFVAALKLIDLGVPRWRLKGSWAGATGYPQFMPSIALRLRADGDGDGYADLWRSEPDGLASIANYLRDAGWKRGVPWGIAVRVPPTLNRVAIASKVTPQRCHRVYARHSRWLTMAEWRSLGVTPLGRSLPETEMATLLEPDGPYATAYLLTSNYRTILDYNCSNFYALSVGLLADAIARR